MVYYTLKRHLAVSTRQPETFSLPADPDKHILYPALPPSWPLVLELCEVALHRGSHTELFMFPNRAAVYWLTATWVSGADITFVCMAEL